MHGNPTRSSALDGVAVSMDHSIGHGLSGLFSALSSEESETETPSFTKAAACLRLADVMRLRCPSHLLCPNGPNSRVPSASARTPPSSQADAWQFPALEPGGRQPRQRRSC